MLPGWEPDLPEAEKKVLQGLRDHLAQHLFEPARHEDLAGPLGTDVPTLKKMQALLIDRGEVLRITSDVALLADAIPQALQKLVALYQQEGAFTASQAKDVLGTTRKFAIPLLEYLDKDGWTRRTGDRREIRPEKLEELS